MALKRSKKEAVTEPEPQAVIVDDQGTETVGEFSAHTIENSTPPEVAQLSPEGCGPALNEEELAALEGGN